MHLGGDRVQDRVDAGQLAGTGSVLAGLILSKLTSPRRSTASSTWARELPW